MLNHLQVSVYSENQIQVIGKCVYSFISNLFFLCVAFLLATQLNNLLEENILEPHCVCKLKRTITNTLSDGRYVFLFLIFRMYLLHVILVGLITPLSCVLGLSIVCWPLRFYSQLRKLEERLEIPLNTGQMVCCM